MSQTSKRGTQISKSLSYLLRHGAEKEKLAIDANGYVALKDILAHNRVKSQKATVEDIERIVENNDKKRFKIEKREPTGSPETQWYICANQGHSIKGVGANNMESLKSISEFPLDVLVHGAYQRNLQSILKNGLSRMGRNHIHFTYDDRIIEVADTEANAKTAISGFRPNSNVLIYLDITRCLESGLKFYKSENNVILSPGNEQGCISYEYFSKVTDRNGRNLLNN